MTTRVLAPALLALILASCAGHDLPKPEGSPFAFNPGQWQPATTDLDVTRTAGQP